jgi:hypothetical protein
MVTSAVLNESKLGWSVIVRYIGGLAGKNLRWLAVYVNGHMETANVSVRYFGYTRRLRCNQQCSQS